MKPSARMRGDWNIEREDREWLSSLNSVPMRTASWRSFKRPVEVDINWHRTENQGPIGSCQGHSLSSVLERLQQVQGKSVQLSEIFAYLATQKLDGLLGSDVGSTISGGVQAALELGCCLEATTGYPQSYPKQRDRDAILSETNYQEAASYKAKSAWKVPQNHDAILDFIGGGGGINFGIAYADGVIPQDRIIREYRIRGRSGGHAMCVLGYDKNGNLRAANSHADGPYLIEPKAWQQMLQHADTVAVGLMGNLKAEPVNWYNNSPYFKLKERPRVRNNRKK